MPLGGKQTKPILQQLNDLQDENKLLKAQAQEQSSKYEALEAELAALRASAAPLAVPAGLPPIPGVGGAPLLPIPGAGDGGLPVAPAALLQPATAGAADSAELKSELDAVKEALAAVKAELDEKDKELTKKVHATTQYQNLKKMMTKKTEDYKKAVTELRKHDPSYGDSDDEVVDDDSDE